MIVRELIHALMKLDPTHEVMKSSCEGCGECNPDGLDYYSSVSTPTVYGPGEAPYPHHKEKTTLVIL